MSVVLMRTVQATSPTASVVQQRSAQTQVTTSIENMKGSDIIQIQYFIKESSIFLLVVVLWIEESPYMVCTEATEIASANTQEECQKNCLQDSNCVGIVYSYNEEHVPSYKRCALCADNNLYSVAHNYGFYRRPGTVQGNKVNLFLLT